MNNMQNTAESLEGVVYQDKLFDRDSSPSKTSDRFSDKSNSLAHLLRNLFVSAGSMSNLLLKKYEISNRNVHFLSLVHFISSQYDVLSNEFDSGHIDQGEYGTELKGLKELVDSIVSDDDLRFHPDEKDPYNGILMKVHEDLVKLEACMGIVDHIGMPESSFEVIANMYGTLQNNLSDGSLKELVISLGEMEEISQNHHLISAENNLYNLHRLDNASHGKYLLTHEDNKKGLYSLYIIEDERIIDKEEFQNKNELDRSISDHILYFNKNPVMTQNFQEYRDMFELLKKEMDINEVSVGGITEYGLADGQKVHLMELELGSRPIRVFRNGSPKSVRVYENGEGLSDYMKAESIHLSDK